jgi:hypothetical protein
MTGYLQAWAGVHDFDVMVRNDHWVVPHHDDCFLWTGAQNAVPRAEEKRPRGIDD